MKHINIAIIGEPNVGKSTFLNGVLNHKLSIVTHKSQTTRNVIKGIVTLDQVQFIFLDTPGIFDAKRNVDKFIVKLAWSSIKNADVVLVLLDVYKSLSAQHVKIFEYLVKAQKPFMIAVNKCDDFSKTKEKYDALVKEIYEKLNQDESYRTADKSFLIDDLKIFHISALNNQYQELLDCLKSSQGSEGWLYSEDEITTLPFKFLAEEVTREKILLYVHEEIPYNVIVKTENMEEKKDEVKIWQVIKVISESHKKIILGHMGSKIKKIGQEARLELQKLYGYNVHLFLHVQVRKSLMDDPKVFSN